ncbi:MAG: hypothetical protein HZB24_09515 [Desulfobacterales bacterium]|nr:hypothetical protein [Desulfobacterales bacterium]
MSRLWAISADIALDACSLPGDFHEAPFDRISPGTILQKIFQKMVEALVAVTSKKIRQVIGKRDEQLHDQAQPVIGGEIIHLALHQNHR